MDHRRRVSALTGFGLAAALLLAAPGARAGITSVKSRARLDAESATGGVFDTAPSVDEDIVSPFDKTLIAQTQGGRATSAARANVTQSAGNASITASGSTGVQHCCVDGEPGTEAAATSLVNFQICTDERSTFTVHAQVNVESAAGLGSTNGHTDLDVDFEEVASLEANDENLPRSVTLDRSGVIGGDGREHCVGAGSAGNASLVANQPSSRTTWTFSLEVSASPQAPPSSEVFLWVGGNAAAFGDPASWDPTGPASEGVPSFVDGVRQDAGVVNIASPVTIDLAGAAATSRAGQPRAPAERKMGRLEVSRTSSLTPSDGTLILDNLSPEIRGMARSVEGRSLEVGGGATLSLDRAKLLARHVAIGSGGDGTVVVKGPNGFLVTSGRFGVGAGGSGNLEISDGGTVSTAEAVLGETDAQGSARITGAGSLWQTGNFAVGLEDDAALTIEGGAAVESAEVSLGFNLDGDEHAQATVQGTAGGGAPSSWTAEKLQIGPRGALAIAGGGQVGIADVTRVGGEGAFGGCFDGRACIRVAEGRLSSSSLEIGTGGSGEVIVESDGRLELGDALVGATEEGSGTLLVLGPSTADQVTALAGMEVPRTAGAHGLFQLEHGAKVQLGERFLVGSAGENARGELVLAGAVADSTETRLIANSSGPDSVVGVPSSEPAGQPVLPTGEVLLRNAVLRLTGTQSLKIERRGVLRGDAGVLQVPAGSAVVNSGLVDGQLGIAGDYVQTAQGTLGSSVFIAGTVTTAQLNPLAASPFARALRRPPPPPPAPAAGPVVVEGDATLDGLAVLQFANGVAPRATDSIELLDVAGSVTGSFADVVVRGLVPGSDFAQDFAEGKLTLTWASDAVPLPTVSLTAKPVLKEKKKAGAKIKVERSGDTSAPMLVSYTIAGTAQNGIDYEALPGTIEIPARKKSAKIVVKPRRDGLVEGPETIELELVPGDDYAPSLFSKVAIELQSQDGATKKKGH